MRISDWSSDVCSSDLTDPSFSGRGSHAVVRGRRRRSDNGRHKAWRERLHHQRYRPSSHGESDTIDAAGPHDLSAPYATDTRQIWGSALQFGFAFRGGSRSEEHTSELQSLMRISYAV